MANFKTLVRTHCWIGGLSVLTFSSIPLIDPSSVTESGKVALPLVATFFGTLHFSIALGCNKKLNGARLASKVCSFMLIPLFPVGTILGIILFENSKK
ncbi:hypothetical protein EYS14_18795 [Alteromonadaceae bacterium M269]|nr:hypothetical protein EYS14_18795 [Alteromonadaceae bacterium M269]